MKKLIFLVCVADEAVVQYSTRDFERLLYYSSLDENANFEVCDDPIEADLILFVGSSESNFSDVRKSNLFRAYSNKCVLYYSGDHLIPLIPGLYPCLDARMVESNTKSRKSGYYLRVTDNYSLEQAVPFKQTDLLYSFQGNCNNHPIRKQLLELSNPRALLVDSSVTARSQTDEDNENYVNLLRRSKFVLCPRGIGTSSWRLFETMRAGRVPVIISDDWVEPEGPIWNTFSIRVREADIGSMNDILIEQEHRWEHLARTARLQWLKFFSESNVFNTIASQALEALQASKNENLLNLKLRKHYFKPFYFRYWLVSPLVRRFLRN